MEPRERIEREIAAYFDGRLAAHGPTHLATDHNSEEARTVRFAQIVRLLDPGEECSVLDYGCAYGALAGYLEERGFRCRYTGFDLAESMVAEARRLYPEGPGRIFTSKPADLRPSDFVLACAIFNRRGNHPVAEWERYVLDTIERVAALGVKGFAFSLLTSYADPPKMRDDLYYADPCRMFDLCKRRYARNVALLHDYGIYDFTILVRR